MKAPCAAQAHPDSLNGNNLPTHDSTFAPSQTASEFIDSQLQLEADAREALPYAFDYCINPLGPLRQNLFSCLTCNPPPESPLEPYNPAGVCYSCSIACHGEHTLVELFGRRNFTCDCGTTRMTPTSPCTLRIDPETGMKGQVQAQSPAIGNTYNKNFQNRFCGCGEIHNPYEEKGTMFQCIGLSNEQDGGCGEDWWHPECVLGLGRDWLKETQLAKEHSDPSDDADAGETEEPVYPLPPGFPQEDDFETFICYKCVAANPWIRDYAGSPGFLMPVFRKTLQSENLPKAELGTLDQPTSSTSSPNESSMDEQKEDAKRFANAQVHGDSNNAPPRSSAELINGQAANGENAFIADSSTNAPTNSNKRKAEDSPENPSRTKRPKDDSPLPLHESLVPAPDRPFSIFLQEDFRDHLCRCPTCYPTLRKYPQLLEEEVIYELPISQTGEEGGGDSVGTGSLLDRGEAALSNVDRVRAIEGVMAYNHLKDKVKSFLKPYAESGQAVSADDIREYFAKLRGDDEAIRGPAGVKVESGSDGAGESREGAERILKHIPQDSGGGYRGTYRRRQGLKFSAI